MITIITSTGNQPDSIIDRRFSRCAYFVIFDDVQNSVHYIPNPYKDNFEHAGKDVVNLVAAYKPAKIVSGEFGLKVKPLLDEMKIQLIRINKESVMVAEIIKLLEASQVIK